jgi:hypothetical protein
MSVVIVVGEPTLRLPRLYLGAASAIGVVTASYLG